MIGGTSIGSMMAALYASETDVGALRERASVFSASMSKLWNKIVDLTYPFTAMFSGSQFNKGGFVCLSVCLLSVFLHLFACLFVCYLFVCLSVCLSLICLTVCLSNCY